jgi:hypothetical protein
MGIAEMVRARGLSHRYERKDEDGNVESVDSSTHGTWTSM